MEGALLLETPCILRVYVGQKACIPPLALQEPHSLYFLCSKGINHVVDLLDASSMVINCQAICFRATL